MIPPSQTSYYLSKLVVISAFILGEQLFDHTFPNLIFIFIIDGLLM